MPALLGLGRADLSSVEDRLKGAREAMAAKNYAEAIKLFNAANKSSHKSCVQCYLGLALAYRATLDGEKELENAKKALEYASEDAAKVSAHELKGDAFLTLASGDSRRLKDAEDEFRAAALLDQSRPMLHLELGVTLLKESRDEDGKRELEVFLASSPSGTNSELARKLIADPRRARQDFAPDFQVTTLDGQDLELSTLSGRVVVLDFWATWCGPCVMGVPELQELVKKYRRDQLVLLSISADSDEERWRTFIEKKHMEWPQFWDKDGSLRNLFSIRAFPTYVVIDKAGIIRQRVTGTDPRASVAYRLKPILETLLRTE